MCVHTQSYFMSFSLQPHGGQLQTSRVFFSESHLSLQWVYDHLLSCLGNSSVVEKDMVNTRVYGSEKKCTPWQRWRWFGKLLTLSSGSCFIFNIEQWEDNESMDRVECGYRGVGLEQTQVIGTSGCWKFEEGSCIEPPGKVWASVAISGTFET